MSVCVPVCICVYQKVCVGGGERQGVGTEVANTKRCLYALLAEVWGGSFQKQPHWKPDCIITAADLGIRHFRLSLSPSHTLTHLCHLSL